MRKLCRSVPNVTITINKNIIKKIVNLVEVKNNNIIEIGPGQETHTEEILKKKHIYNKI